MNGSMQRSTLRITISNKNDMLQIRISMAIIRKINDDLQEILLI